MRSLLLTVFIFALLPMVFFTPFVGVLLWSWVSFGSPQRLVWGIGQGLPFAYIIGLVGIIGWVCSDRRRVPLDATTVLLAALLAMFTISTCFALDPTQAWPKWLPIAKEFVYFFVTAALLTNRVRVHALMWIMVIAVGYYGIKGGVFTLLTGGQSRVWGPGDTAIYDNNNLAAALVVILPLMNYLGRQSKSPLLRVGSRLAMALSLLATLASYSRGAFLALMAIVLWFWRHSRRKILSGIFLIVVLIFSVSFMPKQWVERIQSIQTYQDDASAEGRLDIWRAAIKIAEARPLVGGGFWAPYEQSIVDKYAPGVHARAVHSIWFEVLAENGFIALGLWIALLLVGLNNCRFIIRRTKGNPALQWANDLAHMSMVALIGFIVGGTFLSLPYWDFYYTLIVLVAAVRRITVTELAHEVKRHAAIARPLSRAPSLRHPGLVAPPAE